VVLCIFGNGLGMAKQKQTKHDGIKRQISVTFNAVFARVFYEAVQCKKPAGKTLAFRRCSINQRLRR